MSTHFVLLTATPASNGWEDTYNYFIMFGYYKTKKKLNDKHALWGTMFLGTRRIPKIEGWKDEEVLQEKYDSFTISISKDDALDLPPLIIKDVTFKRSKEYVKIAKDRVHDDVDYDTAPKLAHGLRKFANLKDKLDYVQMLCEATTNNIVIFYYYQDEIAALKKQLKIKSFMK